MSEFYDVVKEKIDVVVETYKVAVSDGVLTLSEVWLLSQEAVASFMQIAKELNISGKEKKEVVMKAAERLYDEVIAPIDIKAVPNVVEPVFDRLTKSFYMEFVSGAIDFIFKYI